MSLRRRGAGDLVGPALLDAEALDVVGKMDGGSATGAFAPVDLHLVAGGEATPDTVDCQIEESGAADMCASTTAPWGSWLNRRVRAPSDDIRRVDFRRGAIAVSDPSTPARRKRETLCANSGPIRAQIADYLIGICRWARLGTCRIRPPRVAEIPGAAHRCGPSGRPDRSARDPHRAGEHQWDRCHLGDGDERLFVEHELPIRLCRNGVGFDWETRPQVCGPGGRAAATGFATATPVAMAVDGGGRPGRRLDFVSVSMDTFCRRGWANGR